ncbi:MAG TPA: antitoxin Xre/MbcA/ParS toxin-binding domain-containing protein [Longimicrobiaceae bacterium]|nr:antitoxin Xre/MbcA/ParS toxin-binding domain-containing protein [Longimicrobiaceae bacterium]
MINARQVARILGGRRVLKREVRSLGDLQEVVADGLPVGALDEAVAYVGATRKEAEQLKDLLVPRATRGRRRAALKPAESERVERLARVMALAEQVWEDRNDARAFLTAAHPLLDGRAPLELARTELGARQVEELLWKLEYSLPA